MILFKLKWRNPCTAFIVDITSNLSLNRRSTMCIVKWFNLYIFCQFTEQVFILLTVIHHRRATDFFTSGSNQIYKAPRELWCRQGGRRREVFQIFLIRVAKTKKEVHKARVRDIRDEQLVIYSWLLCLKKNEKRGRTNYNRGSVEKKKIRSRFIDNHIGQNSRSSL